MIRDIAIKLLPLVNDKKSIDLLNSYMEHRVEELHRLLEQQDNIYDISKTQGAIKEIRRFQTLRDEVVQRAKDKYGGM